MRLIVNSNISLDELEYKIELAKYDNALNELNAVTHLEIYNAGAMGNILDQISNTVTVLKKIEKTKSKKELK